MQDGLGTWGSEMVEPPSNEHRLQGTSPFMPQTPTRHEPVQHESNGHPSKRYQLQGASSEPPTLSLVDELWERVRRAAEALDDSWKTSPPPLSRSGIFTPNAFQMCETGHQ